eukprot:1386342-Karenia_brevis.AAC.1
MQLVGSWFKLKLAPAKLNNLDMLQETRKTTPNGKGDGDFHSIVCTTPSDTDELEGLWKKPS